MPTNDSFQGVSNCYVFKSRLQEYAQKVGLATPVYDTIKEGPSHEPSFRSSVVLNDIKYDSLLGFTNRKAAEQSAAEVALNELAKSGDVSRCISQPVHETGLCKNLLQEYAQKMNYAIPLYQCQKDETPGRAPLFSCTVEIGGIRYIGAAAKTKKEAEIKAARTALLAIQSSTPESYEKQMGTTQLTVIPSKKRAPEPNTNTEETPITPKEKKARFKKKTWKKKPGNKACRAQVENTGNVNSNTDDAKEGPTKETDIGLLGPELLPAEGVVNSQDEKLQCASEKATAEGALVPGKETKTGLLGSEQLPAEGVVNSQDEKHRSEGEKAAAEGALVPHGGLDSENQQSAVSCSNQSNNGTLSVDVSSISCDTTALSKDVNTVSGAEVILNM